MTEQEYNLEMEQIEADFDMAKRKLYVKFANSNRIYKIGDIIKDHCKIIVVERFGVYKSFGLPEPTYIGIELKKDLTPKKSQEIGYIYGNEKTECLKCAGE